MNLTNDERNRSRTKRSNGWLATLGGAALLVAVGFGVGLVAGTAYEEPELVAEHLSGNTTEVALTEGAEVPAAEGSLEGAADVAAAPPEEAAPDAAPPAPLGAGSLDAEREVAAPAAAPLPAAAPTAKPRGKPAGGAGFSIQVGAFASEAPARQLANDLAQRGYSSYVTSEGSGARFKVRVGPIASRPEAERTSEQLKSEQHLPTWILASGKP